MAAMVTLLLLGILHMAVVGSAVSPPPGTSKIVGVTWNGDGCPPGSAEVILSSDAQSLTAIYSQYTASTPGAIKERRKACTLSVAIKYPTGFTFTVAQVTYRGYAMLEKGVVGTLACTYYFSGVTGTAETKRRLPSLMDGNFEYTDKFLTVVYTPCWLTKPRNLNLKSEIRLLPPRSPAVRSGLITVDSQDLSLKQIFRLEWKRC